MGYPTFCLHPCKTAAFMAHVRVSHAELQSVFKERILQVAQKDFNYVWTWLSVFGPLVGLALPMPVSNKQEATNAPS